MLRHRRKHSRAYGAIWDESTTTPTCVRVGQGASAAVSSALPANLAIIQSLMRRCVINDAGVVQYYLDPTDSTLKENGDPANLDGSDGQVMVEIPLAWLKYDYQNNQHTWIISKEQFNGAERLDAFYKNGAWVKNRFMSAYEGTMYDTSRLTYTNGVQLTAGSTDFTAAAKTIHRDGGTHPFSLLEVGDKLVIAGATDGGNNQTVTIAAGGTGDATITVDEVIVERQNDANVTIETEKDFANDILSSVSGKAPINYGTRANFRALADKRGTGWRQQDYDLISAIQLLYLTEYADWNSQVMIGGGLTKWAGGTWDAWNDYNPIETAGNSNANGNATASVANANGVVGSYMSYRGIENLWGHVWKLVDGINVQFGVGADYTGQPYVSNDDTLPFADDVSAGYTQLPRTVPGSIGGVSQSNWQKTLCQQDRGFLPATTGGVAGSSTYICDYYYQSTGWRVAMLGGSAGSGPMAGVACWYVRSSSGSRRHDLGGRLAF